MASTDAQNRWRARNRFTKKQLNVMARIETHAALEDIARARGLRGKAEAVAYCVYLIGWLSRKADGSPEAADLIAKLSAIYHAHRDEAAP